MTIKFEEDNNSIFLRGISNFETYAIGVEKSKWHITVISDTGYRKLDDKYNSLYPPTNHSYVKTKLIAKKVMQKIIKAFLKDSIPFQKKTKSSGLTRYKVIIDHDLYGETDSDVEYVFAKNETDAKKMGIRIAKTKYGMSSKYVSIDI